MNFAELDKENADVLNIVNQNLNIRRDIKSNQSSNRYIQQQNQYQDIIDIKTVPNQEDNLVPISQQFDLLQSPIQ